MRLIMCRRTSRRLVMIREYTVVKGNHGLVRTWVKQTRVYVRDVEDLFEVHL